MCPGRGGHAVAVPPPRGGHAVVYVDPIPNWTLPHWICIHNHEGRWNATGYYHGGLQMDWNFMRAYGKDMLKKYHGQGAEAWTPKEQIIVAERARKIRGWEPWPQTALMCHLRY